MPRVHVFFDIPSLKGADLRADFRQYQVLVRFFILVVVFSRLWPPVWAAADCRRLLFSLGLW